MKKLTTELAVIARTYEFVIWTCQHIAKFPRSYRFTLGEQLELRLYRILEDLLRAKYSKERMAILQAVNMELELLRFQFRLAKDLQCLNVKSYGYAAEKVNEIGQMVGGWLKTCRSVQAGERGA